MFTHIKKPKQTKFRCRQKVKKVKKNLPDLYPLTFYKKRLNVTYQRWLLTMASVTLLQVTIIDWKIILSINEKNPGKKKAEIKQDDI